MGKCGANYSLPVSFSSFSSQNYLPCLLTCQTRERLHIMVSSSALSLWVFKWQRLLAWEMGYLHYWLDHIVLTEIAKNILGCLYLSSESASCPAVLGRFSCRCTGLTSCLRLFFLTVSYLICCCCWLKTLSRPRNCLLPVFMFVTGG